MWHHVDRSLHLIFRKSEVLVVIQNDSNMLLVDLHVIKYCQRGKSSLMVNVRCKQLETDDCIGEEWLYAHR